MAGRENANGVVMTLREDEAGVRCLIVRLRMQLQMVVVPNIITIGCFIAMFAGKLDRT